MGVFTPFTADQRAAYAIQNKLPELAGFGGCRRLSKGISGARKPFPDVSEHTQLGGRVLAKGFLPPPPHRGGSFPPQRVHPGGRWCFCAINHQSEKSVSSLRNLHRLFTGVRPRIRAAFSPVHGAFPQGFRPVPLGLVGQPGKQSCLSSALSPFQQACRLRPEKSAHPFTGDLAGTLVFGMAFTHNQVVLPREGLRWP
jgi:hypothetical protein